jgi:hypothetical protein
MPAIIPSGMDKRVGTVWPFWHVPVSLRKSAEFFQATLKIVIAVISKQSLMASVLDACIFLMATPFPVLNSIINFAGFND